MSKPVSLIQALFFLCLYCLAYLPSAAAADDGEVAVIVSSRIRPFVQALDGFCSGFSQPVTISYVDSNPELVKHKLAKNQFALLVAIGPDAAKIVWADSKADTPKMALMVLDPKELLGNTPLCGIHLRVSASDQFRLLIDRMGPGRKVGIMYNPLENEKWMASAGNSAKDADITLAPLAVTRKQDVVRILSSSVKQIDTLLFIPDSTVISETMVRHIIKKCLLNQIAVVGYNNFFLEAGAVMSFTINYEKVGTMGSKLAEDILTGVDCKLTPPPFEVQWNQKVWDFIRK